MKVIGAGMAGLLAAAMLRDDCDAIIEASPEIPNNHSAILRFRSLAVADALGISFKPVKVMKAIAPHHGNPVADALSYSRKANGTATLRSSIHANGEISERFIAPPDLIQRMVKKADPSKLRLGAKFAPADIGDSIISTIPMPSLMSLLGYSGKKPEFKSIPGVNINATLSGVDAYASVYVPDPNLIMNRVSLTGDKLTIEVAFPGGLSEKEAANFAANSMGIRERLFEALKLLGLSGVNWVGLPKVSSQPYAKILPIDEGDRRRFIMWASDEWGIYSLGRYATWRPGLLMDDVVNDVNVIRSIIEGSNYHHRKGL
jgi:hypothetical protein